MNFDKKGECKEYQFENGQDLLSSSESLESLGLQDLNDSKCVQISLKKNIKTWILYSNNGFAEEECYFTLNDSIDYMPEIANLSSLEQLNISLLGIKTLPKFLEKCMALKSLDISFNNLDIKKEVGSLVHLDKLETLYVFGYDITEQTFDELKRVNPNLNIFHSKEHYLDSIK